MRHIRWPAVAGLFYPGEYAALASTVDQLLADAVPEDDDGCPVALIVPHAGYIYSGPTAAAGYVRLRPWATTIRRVVVLGPAHRVPVHGLALSSADAFATPLGIIPTDPEATHVLFAHDGVAIDDRAHAPEHSIEVHLPFLQRVLDEGWTVVPVIAGSGPAPQLADALAELWGLPGTLFVVSTDLSHYHDLATARRLDRETAATITAASWEHLHSDDACGAVPVRGALELARRHGEHIDLVDLRTSGDTAGDAHRVVGYGSFVVR
jgi:AmmeMemoRadiSam system protein B